MLDFLNQTFDGRYLHARRRGAAVRLVRRADHAGLVEDHAGPACSCPASSSAPWSPTTCSSCTRVYPDPRSRRPTSSSPARWASSSPCSSCCVMTRVVGHRGGHARRAPPVQARLAAAAGSRRRAALRQRSFCIASTAGYFRAHSPTQPRMTYARRQERAQQLAAGARQALDLPHLRRPLDGRRSRTSSTARTWPRGRPASRSPSICRPRPATTATTSWPRARSARSACRSPTSATCGRCSTASRSTR